MRSQSRSTRTAPLVQFIAFGALTVLVALSVAFSGTLFTLASALVTSLSRPPADEYALLPSVVLASRLADAERELSRIRYQSILIEPILAENARLVRELGFDEANETGTGRVVGAPPRTLYDTFLISLSAEHSVRPGDLALFEGFLIGRVVRVGMGAALVELLTAPGVTFDVLVGSPSAIVVAQGAGGGAFVFDIADDVAVSTGDAVVSAKDNARVVGIVRSITADPDRTTKRVYASAPAALSDIRFVTFVQAASRSILEDEVP